MKKIFSVCVCVLCIVIKSFADFRKIDTVKRASKNGDIGENVAIYTRLDEREHQKLKDNTVFHLKNTY